MAKKPTPEIQGSIPAALATALKDVTLRTQALQKAVDKATEILDAYKPDTAAKAATTLVAIEPLWKAIEEEQKKLGSWVNLYRVSIIPERFIAESLGTISLKTSAGNYRFTISNQWRASVVEGEKDKAIGWLNDNGYGEIVQETINASTLSAFARRLNEEENIELPTDYFKVATVPVTSVTKVKA